jgi:hypothetical protein
MMGNTSLTQRREEIKKNENTILSSPFAALRETSLNHKEFAMKKIKITIHKDGTQKVEVLGAVGGDCVQFTQELEKRLGSPIGERELKAEYYESETETEQDYEVDR